jgi:hypothetical protein
MMRNDFNKDSFQNKTMHKHLLKLIVVAFLLSGMFGCKKFLDVQPKDKVPQTILFSDEQGFKDAMNGIYLSFDKPNNGAYGMYGLYTSNLSFGLLSALGYNYDSTATSGTVTNAAFYNSVVRYSYLDQPLKGELDNIWGGMYNTIANINNILRQVDDKKTVFTKDNYYRIKGEAIGARALLHFDLLRMYGQPPLSGAAVKAIPYIRSFGVTSTPFSTVTEALDSCIDDLTQAKNMLAQTDTSKVLQAAEDMYAAYTQNHINYWAVEALLARVYMYKGDFDNASRYANAVIGSGKFPLIQTNVAFSGNTVRDRLFSQELVFSVYSSNVKSYNQLFDATGTLSPLMMRKTTKNTLFTTGSGSAADYRYTSWFDNNSLGVNVPSKYFQDNNLPYVLQNIVPVVRISEMYYIVAECANNKSDINTGVSMLNTVRQSRGLSALNAANINYTDSVSTEIMREYQKEFIQEGQTFFYYKRLNKDLTKVTTTTVNIPNNAYVFPLPDKEVEYNH